MKSQKLPIHRIQSQLLREEGGRILLPLRQLLRNLEASIGNTLFTELVTCQPGQDIDDPLCGGKYACAWFISNQLTLVGLWKGPPQTWVKYMPRDLKKAGWQQKCVTSLDIGDVVIYNFHDGNEHIAIYVGDGMAISTTRENHQDKDSLRSPQKHPFLYEGRNDGPRTIKSVWYHPLLFG